MANLLDRASVVLTPTAYNNGEALCIKPDDGSGDFDFSRNSAATRVNSQGLIETIGVNLPRINYENGCGHYLFEPQSTNLITQSELFSDSSWVKLGAGTASAAIVTSDYAISPDGTQNASRLQCDLNGGGGSVSNQSLIYNLYTSSGNQSLSIYVKSNTGLNQTIYFTNSQTSGNTITVTNEWQRFEFNHITATYVFAIGLIGRNGGAIDDTADILIWGAQVEQQSYATSYIPTNGSQVTRNQDVCTNGGSLATINSTEGVLYAEIAALDVDSLGRYITINDSVLNSNAIRIFYQSSTTVFFQKYVNGVRTTNLATSSITKTDFNKIAIKYNSTDVSVFVNGVNILNNADTNVFAPNTLNVLEFENVIQSPFYGKTKCVAVWKEALSDSELQSLTTI